MTLLFRRISDTKAWRHFVRDPGAATRDLPPWAFAEFTPSARDGTGLSVYEPPDNDEGRAALAASLLLMYDEQHLFIGASASDLEQQGLKIESTDGGTFDSEVNGWHREITVATSADIAVATKVFASGTPYTYTKPESFAAARLRAAQGKYDLMRAFGDSGQNPPRSVVTRLIEKKAATIVPGTAS